MKLRLHVLSLAHTQTTKDWCHCAYTMKVINFCNMMKSLGHTVYLYAGDKNEAKCDELITCITTQEQADLIGIHSPADNLLGAFDAESAHWKTMNRRAIEGIRQRAEPTDLICIIAGRCQQEVANAFPAMNTIEFGIGYEGNFANFRVFESYAWMHTIYGQQQGAHAGRGKFYDRVIPNYYDLKDFPFSAEKDDYFLFVGRLNEDKGLEVAVETSKYLNVPLVMAGQGIPPAGVDYRGLVGVEERGKLMSHARATFVPTLYIEPFGGVAVESMLCGTPVLTTDWGVFPETVLNGVSGFRCHNLKDFILAAQKIDTLDPKKIKKHAKRYDMNVVRHEYDKYFHDIMELWHDGWYAKP